MAGEAGEAVSMRRVSLASPKGRVCAGEAIADFYDGERPGGLFCACPTHCEDQEVLLAAVDRQLSPEDRMACEGALGDGGITADELYAALLQCQPGRMPGSDGLTYEFYRAFWPQLGRLLSGAMTEALRSGGALSESQRTGIIALVYKGTGAGPRTCVTSYRPLTLLNSDFKLLAKAMAIRFSHPLNSVIDPTQSAFLPERWIGDNVLFHLEEIDYRTAPNWFSQQKIIIRAGKYYVFMRKCPIVAYRVSIDSS